MKLLQASVTNFGSYKELTFNFENLGLALVHGPTGAGKSTLQDVAAWILYGVTAKGGAVDEIRSWTSPDEPTKGCIDVDINGTIITVYRTRGSTSQNDLHYEDHAKPGDTQRGKDLAETQRLLEDRLGVSKDLYIAGAYYNEFSPTGGFFTAKAKDRRELFEMLTDLSLAKTILERTSNVKKIEKKALQDAVSNHANAEGRSQSLKSSLEDAQRRRDNFYSDKEKAIAVLLEKIQGFENEKQARIESINTELIHFEYTRSKDVDDDRNEIKRLQALVMVAVAVCPTCGQRNEEFLNHCHKLDRTQAHLEHTIREANPYDLQLEQAEAYNNPYNEQAEIESAKVNPFVEQISKIKLDISKVNTDVRNYSKAVEIHTRKIASLTQLADLSADLRGALLVRSIREIEDTTNRYLETYFDADLRVGFNLNNSDDLDINVYKNGYNAVYKQLSKGQRGLLKLCFSVAVMQAVSNQAGTHFGCVFFDEALDGLDADLKVKAFSLFSELEKTHESILVVEHSAEFKQLFLRTFHVTMQDDVSTVEESQ